MSLFFSGASLAAPRGRGEHGQVVRSQRAQANHHLGGRDALPLRRARRAAGEQTVESTEGISEIWFCEPFPRWGFLRFRVRVKFT